MISLRKLFREAYPEWDSQAHIPDILISGLEVDSRRARKDCLFLAIRGAKQDGRVFVREAISRGAAVIVGEGEPVDGQVPFVAVPESREAAARLAAAFYGNPSQKLFTIGITGTNGKTTSSYLVEHFLKSEGHKAGVIGTINYRYGATEIPAVETTPGPLQNQALLSEMAAAGCRFAVMEVSSHALDQGRVSGIDFKVALFTNLTQDHLDYHGTLENYFECKSRLFSGLAADRVSVINADSSWSGALKKKTASRILTYGIESQADFQAKDLKMTIRGTSFALEASEKKIRVTSPLVGLHNAYNVLGALSVAAASGLDVARCAESLSRFSGVPGRLERLDAGQDFSVFVDFAHTPDGLENALGSLAPHKASKLIVVFGCGGDRDKNKRPKMGRIAAELADSVIVTSDNPRSENPKTIAAEVCAGFPDHFKRYSVVIDRKKAIRQALLDARKGDIVLLAGKGHERAQIVGNEVLPFSDRQEAEKVLNGH
ncbi:MAG: UDP-N-acetylmuramoyl-L-alanyl-D-glutamate--2,6-diaminopimelate ligase [Candidatus Omnitrophica bacterium]|nr:UDP-N-acetylmuramoyl-L-alanyl-D-glutamate--2,6-diaminopimelate ligase [Candidatus Omnitrophota bacterium]